MNPSAAAIPENAPFRPTGAEIIPFPDRSGLDADAVLASSLWARSGFPGGVEEEFDEERFERILASSHARRRA